MKCATTKVTQARIVKPGYFVGQRLCVRDAADDARCGNILAVEPASPSRPRRLTIVGGGYGGCTAAVQFAAACDHPIAITIIEPRAKLGYGLAYSTDDPDHRLNGSPEIHMLHPADADSLHRWYGQHGLLATDPEARAADGRLFIRRADFGRYVNEMTQAQADRMSAGSSMRHVRERACDAAPTDTGYEVATASGLGVESEMVIVATGNAIPCLPSALDETLGTHPHVVASASDLTRLRSLPADARVLVLGTGLTALDVLSTLIRAKHRGAITAISRRGVRPVPYRPKGLPGDTDQPPVLDRIDGAIAPFVAQVPAAEASRPRACPATTHSRRRTRRKSMVRCV